VTNRPRSIGTIGPMTGLEYEHVAFERTLLPVILHAKNVLCGPDETLAIRPAPYSFPYLSRSHMCRYVEGDWLVMLDSDMTFDADTVARLVAAQKRIEQEHGECGVVAGIYPRREMPPKTITVYKRHSISTEYLPLEPGELQLDAPGRCDAVGAGAMLIMRWVIERMVMELHIPPFQEHGALARKSNQELLGDQSDDMAFCRRLRMLDPPVQLWYTPDVQPKHLVTIGLGVVDWLHANQRMPKVRAVTADVPTG